MAENTETNNTQVNAQIEVDALAQEVKKLEEALAKYTEETKALSARINASKEAEKEIFAKWNDSITKKFGENYAKTENPNKISDLEDIKRGLSKDIKATTDEGRKTELTQALAQIESDLSEIRRLRSEQKDLRTEKRTVDKSMSSSSNVLDKVKDLIKTIGDTSNKHLEKIETNSDVLNDIKDALDAINDTLSDGFDNEEKESEKKKKKKKEQHSSDNEEKSDKELKEESELADELIDKFSTLTEVINKKNEALETEDALLASELGKLDLCVTQFTYMRKNADDVTDAIGGTGKKLDGVSKKAKDAGNSLGRGLKSIGSGIGDILSGMLSMLTSVFDKWIAINDATYKYGRTLGMTAQELRNFNLLHMHQAPDIMMKYGVTGEQIAELQKGYTEGTGKANIMSSNQMGAMVATSKFVGADTSNAAVANFNEVGGGGILLSQEYLSMAMERAKMNGLNMMKTSKNFAENIKLASRYSFKNGLSDIAKMTALSDRLHVNLESMASGLDEHFGNVENSIENAAKLQVLGGSFGAQFSNPLELMNMAKTDMAGLISKFTDTVKGMGKFNKDTGQVEISAFNRDLLKNAADALGIKFDDILNTVNAEGKAEAVDNQTRLANTKENESRKEWLRNNAEFDQETKKWYVTRIDGKGNTVKQNVDTMNAEDVDLFRATHTKEDQMADDVHALREHFLGKREKEAGLATSSFTEKVNATKDAVLTTGAAYVDPLMHKVDKMLEGIMPHILPVLRDILDAVTFGLRTVYGWLKDTLGWLGNKAHAAGDSIQSGMNKFGDWAKAQWWLPDCIGNASKSLGNFIGSGFHHMGDALKWSGKNLGSIIVGGFLLKFLGVGKIIRTGFSATGKILGGILDVGKGLINVGVSLVKGVGKGVMWAGGKLWQGAKAVGRGAMWVGNKAWQGAKAVGRGVSNTVSSGWNALRGNARWSNSTVGGGNRVTTAIRNGASRAWNATRSAGRATVNGVRNIPTAIRNGASRAGNAVGRGFSAIANSRPVTAIRNATRSAGRATVNGARNLGGRAASLFRGNPTGGSSVFGRGLSRSLNRLALKLGGKSTARALSRLTGAVARTTAGSGASTLGRLVRGGGLKGGIVGLAGAGIGMLNDYGKEKGYWDKGGAMDATMTIGGKAAEFAGIGTAFGPIGTAVGAGLGAIYGASIMWADDMQSKADEMMENGNTVGGLLTQVNATQMKVVRDTFSGLENAIGDVCTGVWDAVTTLDGSKAVKGLGKAAVSLTEAAGKVADDVFTGAGKMIGGIFGYNNKDKREATAKSIETEAYERQKMGKTQISDPALMQKAALATCKIHDLLISQFNKKDYSGKTDVSQAEFKQMAKDARKGTAIDRAFDSASNTYTKAKQTTKSAWDWTKSKAASLWHGLGLAEGGVVPSISNYADGGVVNNYANGGVVSTKHNYCDGGVVNNYANGGVVSTKHNYCDGGVVNHYANGGVVQHFADGGTVNNINQYQKNGGIVHAATGTIIPAAQRKGPDSVRAALAPGEIVMNQNQQRNLWDIITGIMPFSSPTRIAQPYKEPTPSFGSGNISQSININISGTLKIDTGNGAPASIDAQQLANNSSFIKMLAQAIDGHRNSMFNGGTLANEHSPWKLSKV